MGKRDSEHGVSDIDRYRKRLGKHEFKGKSKRDTLAIRGRAQAKRTSSPIKDGLILLGVMTLLMGGIYLLFYYGYVKRTV